MGNRDPWLVVSWSEHKQGAGCFVLFFVFFCSSFKLYLAYCSTTSSLITAEKPVLSPRQRQKSSVALLYQLFWQYRAFRVLSSSINALFWFSSTATLFSKHLIYSFFLALHSLAASLQNKWQIIRYEWHLKFNILHHKFYICTRLKLHNLSCH